MEIKPQGSLGKSIKKNEQKQLKIYKLIFVFVITALILIIGTFAINCSRNTKENYSVANLTDYDVDSYAGQSFMVLNSNVPFFKPEDYGQTVFEEYSELDSFGRCGVAFANICHELMPLDTRGEIGHIKPSGWKQEKYPGIVDSEPPYLYNRCHLIGFQLAGENDNEKNLITGTRYFNVNGMLPFENAVRTYVDETDNHVLYRVTPVYDGDALVASGVIMEAWSVEDAGKGISFNVFVYNVQPGIIINYSDGSSVLEK